MKAEVDLMVNKISSRQTSGRPQPLDESWWASVLAEEEEHSGSPAGRHGSSSLVENKVGVYTPATRPAPVDWQLAQDTYEQDETVCLEVVGHNRGGLLVEGGGLQGFVPLSHLIELANEMPETDQVKISAKLATYLGRMLQLKIIECEPERGRVVFSERAALAEPGRRNQLLDILKPSDIVSGVVTNITDFGVFVDLGGVEGLIHVSELSWGRVRHPSDAALVGDTVGAYVIQVDKERCRVALSLKRMNPNPWETAEKRYRPGQVTEATVTSLVPFGAFARLEEGLDGLIHISEMVLEGEKINPKEYLQEGQNIKVRILHVDCSRQRLGLSMRITNDE
jgi:small subunit ribosomal protein S1